MATDKIKRAPDLLRSAVRTHDFTKYLATKGHLDGDRDHLGQQTAVEGHHEGHRVVVREHQRYLEGGERTARWIQRCLVLFFNLSTDPS